MGHDSHTGRMEKRSEDPKSPSPAYRKGERMAREGCSVEVGRGFQERALTMERVSAAVVVLLTNPNVRTIIVDRQDPPHTPYVLALSTSWNETRAMVENKDSLTRALVAGGPIEELAKSPVGVLTGETEGAGKEG
jgi:hypothetical protein